MTADPGQIDPLKTTLLVVVIVGVVVVAGVIFSILAVQGWQNHVAHTPVQFGF